jgi:hypothetical protein
VSHIQDTNTRQRLIHRFPRDKTIARSLNPAAH